MDMAVEWWDEKTQPVMVGHAPPGGSRHHEPRTMVRAPMCVSVHDGCKFLDEKVEAKSEGPDVLVR